MTFWNKLSKIEDYIHKYWHYILAPFVAFILITQINKDQDENKEIDQHIKKAVGKIVRSSSIPKKSKRIFYYTFYVRNKQYKGSTTSYISEGPKVDTYYQVEYSSENPEINRLNFNYQFIPEYKKNEAGIIIDTIYHGL